MKTVLHYQMVTAAGAGTYAATLIGVNGKPKSESSYKAPRKAGVTNVQIMGANGLYITVARDDHPGDDLVLIAIADTLADQFKEIPIKELLGGKGAVLNASEGMSMTVTVGGNATINIFVEVDDQIATVNARGVRAAGANAAIASEMVETGANVYANFQPGDTYRARAIYATSTTIVNLALGLNGKGLISTPGQNAVVTGQKYHKLDDEQAALMTGTGSDYSNTFEAWITATAADAAAVQILGMLFEKS